MSTVQVSCETPFALMIGVTTNGGLKFIALVGEPKLEQQKLAASILSPGSWFLLFPKGFSRKMSVELSTLMVTSKLMTGFEDPPAYLKKLRQQAMIQALRTRKRYKAVVGDAKNSKDFEIKVLKPEQPEGILQKLYLFENWKIYFHLRNVFFLAPFFLFGCVSSHYDRSEKLSVFLENRRFQKPRPRRKIYPKTVPRGIAFFTSSRKVRSNAWLAT